MPVNYEDRYAVSPNEAKTFGTEELRSVFLAPNLFVQWDVYLKSLFFLSEGVAKQFKKQNSGGKIINIASMLSFQGGIRVPSCTAYDRCRWWLVSVLITCLRGCRYMNYFKRLKKYLWCLAAFPVS